MNAAQIKPPFLLGDYHCSNWFPFAVVNNEKEFRIEVVPTPKKTIAVITGIIALFFLGFLWFVAGWESSGIWVIIAVGVLTTIGTPLLINYQFSRERRLGPVLICPSDESFVYLSRRGKKITIGEIDLLAVVTADAGGGDQVSQLQLHLKSGERFHLVTAFSKKELRPMAGKIQSCLKMPVVFLKQKSRHELVEEVQN